jgi:signal transduction histidine kinase
MPVLILRASGGNEVSRVALGPREVVIGRLAPVDILIDDALVSAKHARVYAAEGRFVLKDLGSRNGTWLNGERVSEGTLRIGDSIRIGGAEIAVEAAGPHEPPGSARARHGANEDPTRVALEKSDAMPTMRLELDEVRERGIGGASEDTRLGLVWRAGEELNRLKERQPILDAVRMLLELAFAPGRAFVLAPVLDGAQRLVPLSGTLDDARPPSRTVVVEAVEARSAVLAKRMGEDERYKAVESVAAARIESAIAAPLICGGRAEAIIYCDRGGGRPFAERDLRLLGLIANHVAAALENALHMAELAAFSRELEQKVIDRTAEVRRQADEIARLAAEKDELIGIAAHDIRGPLTTILGFLELARANVAAELDPAALDQDLRVIEDSARSVAKLLGDLLDLKKIEAGKIRIEPVVLEARKFVELATALGALQARQRGIEFAVEVDAGLTLRADPHRLEQALTNLVANALKFSSAGGRVEVTARRVAGGAELAVVDTGPGIPSEELARLFAPYVQGEAGRKVPGTGLGLAIARKLVELHGGRIWAEPAPGGRGSRFAFVIPG